MVGITEAGKLLGVTPKTLRVWEKEGKLTSYKTFGKHRRYDENELMEIKKK